MIQKKRSHLSCYMHLWEEAMLPSCINRLHFFFPTLLYFHPECIESGHAERQGACRKVFTIGCESSLLECGVGLGFSFCCSIIALCTFLHAHYDLQLSLSLCLTDQLLHKIMTEEYTPNHFISGRCLTTGKFFDLLNV